jgi:pimeloyl-ACP methyl ester carboxylesterase
MAADIRALMERLGIPRAAIIGHDRGARVATRFAKDHPEAIARLGVLDNVPTRVIFERMDAEIARGHWFFIFNQVPDLPEALIAGREEVWLRFILQGWTYDPEALTPEEIAAYVRAYQKPGAVRGAMSDYRAGREDVAQDKEDAERKITCPTLALWGQDFELVGRMFDVEAIWRDMAANLRAVSIPHCGHLPQEERPEEVNAALLDFLDGWAG